METLTDVSSSLDDSLSPRGFGRRASSGSAGGRVGIRGRNLKPQPPQGPCPSDVSSDLGSSFGSGSSSVAPDSGGGGDAGGGAIRSRRHVKGDARAAARASRHDAQVHGEGSPVTATRVVGGAGAAAGAKMPSFAPRGFGPGPASSRPDSTSLPPAGRHRHPTAPSAAPSAASPAAPRAARARACMRARPGSCPRALRRRRMRLVAPSRRARRWWQSWSGNARRARWRPRRRGVRGVRRRRSTRRRASSRSGWTASGDRSGRSGASPRSWDERRGGCRTVVTKKSVRASLTELERRGPKVWNSGWDESRVRRPSGESRQG